MQSHELPPTPSSQTNLLHIGTLYIQPNPVASFQLFLGGGGKFFLIFQCHRTIEKLEKKQHFTCTNWTLRQKKRYSHYIDYND